MNKVEIEAQGDVAVVRMTNGDALYWYVDVGISRSGSGTRG
jgi:hypothetical protein